MSKAATKEVKAIPAPSSNWKALKQVLRPSATSSPVTTLKRKRGPPESLSSSAAPEARSKISLKGKEREDSAVSEDRAGASGVGKKKKGELPIESILSGGKEAWQSEPGQYLGTLVSNQPDAETNLRVEPCAAVDCEMVGVGPEGSESTLARVSIVNYHGVVMMDQFVRPREKVTDYRTWVSGVREEDLRSALPFTEVQKEVAALIKDRILIGHAISNDTQALLLSHPRSLIRDTAKYAPLQGLARTKRPGLKTLAKLVLGLDIQSGEHSSVDDARATMAIYRSQKTAWEDALRTHTKPVLVTSTTPALSALDLSNVSTSGVAKSTKPKTLGLAATMRHARHEAELEAAIEMGDEEAEEQTRKKAKLEEDDGLVLGFDFEPKKAPVVVPKVVKPVVEVKVKKVKKDPSRSFKGDREKRPKSKEGWWDES
ncbi:RNA exonuclease 4, partial [Phenoliferia sp. Uapishka_3]